MHSNFSPYVSNLNIGSKVKLSCILCVKTTEIAHLFVIFLLSSVDLQFFFASISLNLVQFLKQCACAQFSVCWACERKTDILFFFKEDLSVDSIFLIEKKE